MVNGAVAMLRQLFPKDLKNSLMVGLTCDERLDRLFLVPNAEFAAQRMLGRMKDTLKRRYYHEQTFSLGNHQGLFSG
jgi:hypothetical protein